jgi:hypothetical protein|tara:strand:+ start:81 stop:401 length:321 start_codon:yes stop_codon:yes gene_type:complete
MTKRERWQSIINEWESSGQTKQAFLKQKNINQSTFYYWIKKTSTKNDDDNKENCSFISIPRPAPSNTPSTGEAEVSLGPAKIKLSVSDATSLLISLHQAGVLHDQA